MMYALRSFNGDRKLYGRAVAWWNFRFNVGFAILPGVEKRAMVEADGDQRTWRTEGVPGGGSGEFAEAHVQ